MSFNLKAYKKTLDNANIDKRLEDSREKSIKVPEVLNEKQLESYRSKEKTVLIQSLLEDKRTGEDTEITEKRLDTHKSKFANNYRNPAAYEGDMNKLEEKRLSNKPTEKIKYEAASSTPKKLRWWENVKSPDGLKVAKTVIAQTSEELSFDTPRFTEVGEEEGLAPEEKEPIAINDAPKSFEEIENQMSEKDRSFGVMKEKYIPSPAKDFPAAVYMVLDFDPEAFADNMDIKQAALDKIIAHNPNLAGKISIDNLGEVKEGVQGATITMRATGPELIPVVNKALHPEMVTPVESEVPAIEEGSNFIEEIYEQKEIDGTPMVLGSIKVNEAVTPDNKGQVAQEILTFIREKHPELEIEKNSLDLSNIEQGRVRFIVGAPMESGEDFSVEEDFKKMEEPTAEEPTEDFDIQEEVVGEGNEEEPPTAPVPPVAPHQASTKTPTVVASKKN